MVWPTDPVGWLMVIIMGALTLFVVGGTGLLLGVAFVQALPRVIRNARLALHESELLFRLKSE